MSKKDFATEMEYRKQLFTELIEIVGELGWQIAMPEGEEDEEVPGLVIGTEEYVTKITGALDGKPE